VIAPPTQLSKINSAARHARRPRILCAGTRECALPRPGAIRYVSPPWARPLGVASTSRPNKKALPDSRRREPGRALWSFGA
jgi:hypothetical protein